MGMHSFPPHPHGDREAKLIDRAAERDRELERNSAARKPTPSLLQRAATARYGMRREVEKEKEREREREREERGARSRSSSRESTGKPPHSHPVRAPSKMHQGQTERDLEEEEEESPREREREREVPPTHTISSHRGARRSSVERRPPAGPRRVRKTAAQLERERKQLAEAQEIEEEKEREREREHERQYQLREQAKREREMEMERERERERERGRELERERERERERDARESAPHTVPSRPTRSTRSRPPSERASVERETHRGGGTMVSAPPMSRDLRQGREREREREQGRTHGSAFQRVPPRSDRERGRETEDDLATALSGMSISAGRGRGSAEQHGVIQQLLNLLQGGSVGVRLRSLAEL
ncbi:hypothetical protein KIPB_012139, partial [Kipferlia bialata]|eukprot:g12139.t1